MISSASSMTVQLRWFIELLRTLCRFVSTCRPALTPITHSKLPVARSITPLEQCVHVQIPSCFSGLHCLVWRVNLAPGRSVVVFRLEKSLILCDGTFREVVLPAPRPDTFIRRSFVGSIDPQVLGSIFISRRGVAYAPRCARN